MSDIIIEVDGNEIIFKKDGEIIELNQFGEKALATAIVYHDMKKMFADPMFKNCSDKLLDTFNDVKKEYDEIKAQLNITDDFYLKGT